MDNLEKADELLERVKYGSNPVMIEAVKWLLLQEISRMRREKPKKEEYIRRFGENLNEVFGGKVANGKTEMSERELRAENDRLRRMVEELNRKNGRLEDWNLQHKAELNQLRVSYAKVDEAARNAEAKLLAISDLVNTLKSGPSVRRKINKVLTE